MSLKSAKIFLCIVISLTVCQYTRSQYLHYPDDADDADDSVVLEYDLNTNMSNYGNMGNYDNTSNYDEATTKIAGGKYAKLGDFPYMAVVHQLHGNGVIGQCGGTILSKRWVLTAGHCVVKYPQRFFVVFGIVNKSGIGYDFLRGPGISMIATQAYVHPQYRETHNDIALLYMPHDIPFSNTVQPIRLAYQGGNFAYNVAFVIGWGKDNMASKGTKSLKYATLPIIENNKCRQYWRITDKHVCTAPGLGRDACQGDSGGPLVVVGNGMDHQIGVVSYGDAFCPSNEPGVFTRVSSFIGWIHEITKLKL